MDVFDAIRERRSHRAFVQKSVEPEKVELILEAAQWAPSPVNSQPWEFIVITGEAARSRVADISKEARVTGSVEIHGFSLIRPAPYASEDDTDVQENHDIDNYDLSFLKNVPVMVAVVGNPESAVRHASSDRSGDGYKYACAAAIQNMLLAAHAQGLGSLWFTYFDRMVLSTYLNVPASKHLIAIVCLGYPESTPVSPGRFSRKSSVRRMA